jgi:hypothetical protein
MRVSAFFSLMVFVLVDALETNMLVEDRVKCLKEKVRMVIRFTIIEPHMIDGD